MKKLTRKQKDSLAKNRYDFMQYFLERQYNNSYIFVHKETRKILKLKFK